MQKILVKRKVSLVIKPLIIGLLLVVMLLSLALGGFLLYKQEQERVLSDQQQQVKIPIAEFNGFGVADDGSVFVIDQKEGTPRIYAQTDALYGGELVGGEAFKVTLATLTLLKQHGIAVEAATIYNDTYMALTLPNAMLVLYSTNTDPELMASSLQTMQSVFTIEGKFPNEIDFRFTKPVIRY